MLPWLFEFDACASLIWNMLWPMQTNAWITERLRKGDEVAYVMLRWHRNLDAPLFKELCLRAKFDLLSTLVNKDILHKFAKDMRFEFLTDLRFLPTLRRFLLAFEPRDLYRIYQTTLPIELGIAINDTPELEYLNCMSVLAVRFMLEGNVEKLKICLDLPYRKNNLKNRERWMFSYLSPSIRDRCNSDIFYLTTFGHGSILSLDMLSFLCSDRFKEFDPVVSLKDYFSNFARPICPDTLAFLYQHEIIFHENDCDRFYEFVLHKKDPLVYALAAILVQFPPKHTDKLSASIDFLIAEKNHDILRTLLSFTSEEQRKLWFVDLVQDDLELAVSLWKTNSFMTGKQFMNLFHFYYASTHLLHRENLNNFLRHIDFAVDIV